MYNNLWVFFCVSVCCRGRSLLLSKDIHYIFACAEIYSRKHYVELLQ